MAQSCNPDIVYDGPVGFSLLLLKELELLSYFLHLTLICFLKVFLVRLELLSVMVLDVISKTFELHLQRLDLGDVFLEIRWLDTFGRIRNKAPLVLRATLWRIFCCNHVFA